MTVELTDEEWRLIREALLLMCSGMAGMPAPWPHEEAIDGLVKKFRLLEAGH